MDCDYFHSEADGSNNIRPTSEMPNEDKRLLTLPKDKNHCIFAENGSFRGCVRLLGLRIMLDLSRTAY